MKAALTIIGILAAIVGASFVSYEVAYQRGVQKAQAAAFYDAYRAAIYNGYFVARSRPDAYYWSVDSIVSRYSDFLSASKELGVSEKEKAKTEKLIARYYFARGEDIPAGTAALFSSVPARETFPLPEIPSPERLRSAIDAGPQKK
jgi:hypothetical protein